MHGSAAEVLEDVLDGVTAEDLKVVSDLAVLSAREDQGLVHTGGRRELTVDLRDQEVLATAVPDDRIATGAIREVAGLSGSGDGESHVCLLGWRG
jgi:hypothetical protein